MKTISIKRAFKILVFTTCIIVSSGCSESSKYKENVSVASVDIAEDYAGVEKNQIPDAEEKPTENGIPKDLKIIKSSNSRYKVKDVKHATETIKRMASAYNAYISDLRFENDSYKKEMRFTIKIPALHFDTMLDSVGKVSQFTDYETITTTDVTEEYVDLQTRLKTKMEVKERYESILRKNAKTVEDILATEDKLRVLQEEIESAKGRLDYLTNKVSYSTMQIDLYESVDFKQEPNVYHKSFWSKTKDGLVFGWDLIESIVVGLFYIWPLVIIAIIILILIRRRMKKRK